ncbi:ABC transporter ATP-binding protein [Intestinibacter bartlettii]|uniref:ABC transporter ATP-binding protein n=1 Tax=Intestinibacter bartlettii TaxID=261299 RepID=A0ABS8CVW0_9FIRM|nr:ABC transporter ATP-binding protein [Intestinibacter bartlettii]MCB5396766.1 ABC transporter ATP-binding protein [Intestinibacter bartlettii]MCB5403315.1 ABC transporter ATP-binding protein [Intestinibacter bartlettii]MCB5445572.1 ABC transporter ATP-binding protein [Intestinibacter bartlettii]MCB5748546.1 ABC transporter ATP-binding protein [Intestinibacter bartlettii]
MIKLENISFSYNKKKEFIQDLSLEFKSGEITTILGPNGSGKSTLLHMMSTYLKPKSGKIYLGDKDLGKLKQKEIAKYISCVYQENEAPDDITVRDLVSFGRNIYSNVKKEDKEENKRMIDFALKATGIEEIQDKKVVNLSGGQKQRAFIAMSLAQNTEVLLLDEPTTYLDIYHQIEILEVVKSLNEKYNITIVMVLHDLNQAINYSHNIVIMKNGNLIKQGKATEVLNEQTIKDVYNVSGYIHKKDNEEIYFIPKKIC